MLTQRVFEMEGALQQQLDRVLLLEDALRTRTQDLSGTQRQLRETQARLEASERARATAAAEAAHLVDVIALAVQIDTPRRQQAEKMAAAAVAALSDAAVAQKYARDTAVDTMGAVHARIVGMLSQTVLPSSPSQRQPQLSSPQPQGFLSGQSQLLQQSQQQQQQQQQQLRHYQ